MRGLSPSSLQPEPGLNKGGARVVPRGELRSLWRIDPPIDKSPAHDARQLWPGHSPSAKRGKVRDKLNSVGKK